MTQPFLNDRMAALMLAEYFWVHRQYGLYFHQHPQAKFKHASETTVEEREAKRGKILGDFRFTPPPLLPKGARYVDAPAQIGAAK